MVTKQTGKLTIDRLQKEALYRETHPDPMKLGDPRRPYKDAAKSLLKDAISRGSPIEVLAYGLLGPEFVASLAFALDIGAPFLRGSTLITAPNRLVTNKTRMLPLSFEDRVDIRHFANYYVDGPPIPVKEFLLEEKNISSEIGNKDITIPIDGGYRWDTTVKSRGKSSPFGALDLYRPELHLSSTDRIIAIDERRFYLQGGHNIYDRFEILSTRIYDGPIAFPIDLYTCGQILNGGNAFASNNVVMDFPSILAKAMLNKPTYNTFYQLAELHDVPLMLKKTVDMYEFLREVVKDPEVALLSADKAFSNALINKRFGYDSLVSAVKSILSLPTKAAKRLNYLLDRSGKVTNSRSGKKYPARDSIGILPPFEYYLPPWAELTLDNRWAKEWSEVKCVVNQTPNFPKAAVPELSDSTFRDILGVNPRIVDLYNLIPWTWFIDWFAGLGDYIDCISLLNTDNTFVNYGFFTHKGNAQIGHDFSARVVNTHRSYLDISEFGQPSPSMDMVYANTELPEYELVYSNDTKRDFNAGFLWDSKFHVRADVSVMAGVSTSSNLNGELSDSQSQIIAALANAKKRDRF